jgi:hypothetical protein
MTARAPLTRSSRPPALRGEIARWQAREDVTDDGVGHFVEERE